MRAATQEPLSQTSASCPPHGRCGRLWPVRLLPILLLALMPGTAGGADPGDTAAEASARRTLTVVATGDLKGWVSRPALQPGAPATGLAHLAGIIRALQARGPTLLLDAGDTLNGAPHRPGTPVRERFPVLPLMNALGYDAATIGNLDLRLPAAVLAAAREAVRFPWLGANLVDAAGEPVLPPYAVLERDGVRMGVLGLTLPGAPPDAFGPQVRAGALLPAARRWVPHLRRQEHVDVVVGLLHSGLDGSYNRDVAVRRGGPLPNAAGRLADGGLGFDLLVAGHAHRLSPRSPRTGSGSRAVPVLEPGGRGDGLAVATLHLAGQGGGWRVVRVERRTERAEAEPDPGALARAAPALRRTRAWLDEQAAVRWRRVPSRAGFYRCAGALGREALLGALEPDEPSPAPARLSLLPLRWWHHEPLEEALGSPLTRGTVHRWLPFGEPVVRVRLTGRQMARMLAPYVRHVRGWRTRPSLVLAPGGFTPRIAPDGSQILRLERADGSTLRPHARHAVWLTEYIRRDGGGLAARALAADTPVEARAPGTLRAQVFAYLQEPAQPLPEPCRRFLAR